MRTRIVFRVTRCLLTGAIVFLLSGALLFELDDLLGPQFTESVVWLAQRGIPEACLNAIYMLQQALIFVVPFGLGLFMYDRLVRRPDGYTRCGNCGAILEQLERPRCPACGNPI